MYELCPSTVEIRLPVELQTKTFYYIAIQMEYFTCNTLPVIDQRKTYVAKLRNGVPSPSLYSAVDMVVRWLFI